MRSDGRACNAPNSPSLRNPDRYVQQGAVETAGAETESREMEVCARVRGLEVQAAGVVVDERRIRVRRLLSRGTSGQADLEQGLTAGPVGQIVRNRIVEPEWIGIERPIADGPDQDVLPRRRVPGDPLVALRDGNVGNRFAFRDSEGRGGAASAIARPPTKTTRAGKPK